MNHLYSVVWSKALGAWVVASELAKQGRGGASRDRRAVEASVTGDFIARAARTPASAAPLRLAILLALCGPAHAVDLYWDTNDATAGAGGPTPSGTWSTLDATLSLDPAGAAAVSARTTTTADRLIFSAGTDATGTYTVTVSGTQNIGGLLFQEGTVDITGGTINFGGVSGLIQGDATADSISSVITGTGGLRFSGGTVRLTGTAPNTFTGTTQVGGFGLAQASVVLAAPGGNAISGNHLQIGGNNGTSAGFVSLGAANQINDTATVQMNSGHYSGSSIFTLNGFDETIGGITLHHQGQGSSVTLRNGAATDATLTLAGSGTYTTASGDRTFGRSLQNGGAGRLHLVVSLTGTGMQTLAGTDAPYSGTTTINSGTLRLWNTSNWASDVTLNGGTLQMHQTAGGTGTLAGAATRTHARTIAGTGGTLRKTGDGTVILTGTNTYQGATAVDQGTLRAGTASAFGISSAVSLANTAGATLDLNNFNIAVGSLAGGGTNGGNVTLGSATLTTGGNGASSAFAGAISGTGSLVKIGAGVQGLTGCNSSYAGITTINAGALEVACLANGGVNSSLGASAATAGNLLLNAGTLRYIGAGGNTDRRLTLGGSFALESSGTGAINFTSTDALTFSGAGARTLTLGGTNTGNNTLAALIGDAGADATSLTKNGGGTWVLTGNNTYTGTTTVSGGTLRINGDQSAASALTTVQSGGTLGGIGTIGGDVLVTSGGRLAPGNSPGTLTINGDLLLDPGSRLDFEFGAANVVAGPLNDLLEVQGDLVLDGTIDVTLTPGGSFGAGIYRVINYDGTLTDNVLDLGTMPAGSDVFVQTAIANQVNLVNTAGLTLNFWDGPPGPKNDSAVQGGSGAWRLAGGSNDWTGSDGAINADYTQNSFAVFAGTPGTVTVDNTNGGVGVAGMQFAVGGYVIDGDALTLAGTNATARVGDGTLAGTAMTATIDAELTGAAQLVKADLGTLVLNGANTYTGGTEIQAGTLQISSDANLGAAAGALSFDGGTLRTTATFGSARDVVLDGAGTLLTDTATTLTLSGLVAGAGSLTKTGGGAVVLDASNTYTGGTRINGGEVQVSSDANLGGASGALSFDGGTLHTTTTFSSARDVSLTGAGTLLTDAATTLTLNGPVSGAGSLRKEGAGTLILDSSTTYTGGTTIAAGTLQIGSGGATGGIAGDIANNSLLVFNRANTLNVGGVVSGSGAVTQLGAGTTLLTGNNSYGGATTVSAGALLVNGNQSAATGLTSVASGATLGGLGTIGGDVSIAGGATLAPGSQDVGTLTINGDLLLGGAARLDYEFGQSNAVGGPLNDLVAVGGDLTLDGTIDVTVTSGGSFDVGLYRVASYGGALIDNGLALGTMPAGSDVRVQTSIANQVNLVNTAGLTLNFWDGDAGPKTDGAVAGGNGVWQAGAGNNNWTEQTGATNAPYSDGTFAIFAAAPGAVTIDDTFGAVAAGGMQFASNGYVISGDALGLLGAQATVRVGDGSSVGAGMTATIASQITGSSQLVKTDLGTLRLSGANSYSGGTRVTAGTLLVNGDQSGALGLVDVASGATLGGNGTIGGDVSIAGGAVLAPGDGVGTLTINGDLSLGGASTLRFAFGQANTVGGALNDLVDVRGDLTLDGTLDVTVPGGGAFGAGVYRVFNYAGALIDSGLELGAMPAGSSAFVQTSIANQVNLVNTAGLALTFWDGPSGTPNDGVIHGGNGVWRVSALDNIWTSATGEANGPYANGGFAVFSGTPGTVTIDNADGAVTASGMQFAVDGYVLGGGDLTLVGAPSVVRVGDGTATGAGMRATVQAVLTGTGALDKADLGTLVLTGANTYAGGTVVAAGVLQLGNGGASGSIEGDVQNDATLVFNRSDTHVFDGAISGSGAVRHIGAGTTVLSGVSTYTGGTTVATGTLQVDGSLIGSATTVADGATLAGIGSVGSVTASSGATVAPGNAATPFGVLTMTGDYTGQATLVLNTVLGNESSPTSRLAINGATTGAASPILIRRVGGDGAQTSGDGIGIVRVDGASPAGSFRLGQPVQAGAYEYLLYQGGVTDSNDWYLRSQLIDRAGATPPAPAYRPGVAGYVLGHQLGLEYGFSALGGLRARAGDQGRLPATQGDRPEDAWMRVYGHELSLEGARFEARDAQITTLSFGTDIYTFEVGGGNAHLGVMASVGESRATLFDPMRAGAGLAARTGTIEMDVKGGGAYWTWHGRGSFIDLSTQVLHYENRYRDQYLTAARQDGWGATFAAEAGSAFALGASGWSIEPRLRLAYQRLELDRFADQISTVNAAEGEGLRGRVALEVFRNPADWLGMANASPFVTLGVQRDFEEPASVTVGATSVHDELPDTTVDASLGFTGSVRPGVELHLDAGYQHSTEGERDGARANFGFRMTF